MLYAVTKLKVHKINTNSTLIVVCLFNPFCENIDFFALHFFFVFPSVQAVEARELETKKERIPSCLSQFLDKNGEFRQIKGGRLFFVIRRHPFERGNFEFPAIFCFLYSNYLRKLHVCPYLAELGEFIGIFCCFDYRLSICPLTPIFEFFCSM